MQYPPVRTICHRPTCPTTPGRHVNMLITPPHTTAFVQNATYASKTILVEMPLCNLLVQDLCHVFCAWCFMASLLKASPFSDHTKQQTIKQQPRLWLQSKSVIHAVSNGYNTAAQPLSLPPCTMSSKKPHEPIQLRINTHIKTHGYWGGWRKWGTHQTLPRLPDCHHPAIESNKNAPLSCRIPCRPQPFHCILPSTSTSRKQLSSGSTVLLQAPEPCRRAAAQQ